MSCQTQRAVDYHWKKLARGGGQPGDSSWLKDTYGVWWQIVTTALMDLLGSKDRAKAASVMQAMMQMTKSDLKKLIHAAARPRS